jgi:hypothetical protein
MVETADEGVGPALLDETTSGAGSDGPAAGGGRGPELDPVIPTLFPKDGPVAGVAVQQRGVAPAEEERMEFWKEGPGGGEIELHAGFLTLTHRNDRPLVPGAAEERGMVLLEKVVGVFSREEAGGFPRETSEAWNTEAEEGKRKRPNSGKPEAGYCFPGRDAGDGEDGGVNLGVEVEEGGKVGR